MDNYMFLFFCDLDIWNTKRHIPELKLKTENKEIKQVKEFDFLGISVDKNFSWKSHIDTIGFKI